MPKPLLNRLLMLKRLLRGVDAILVTNMSNVRYLTGFTGSSGFTLISRTGAVFATDFRYKEQAIKEVAGWELLIEKDRLKTIKMLVRKLGIKTLGIETSVSYESFMRLKKAGTILKPMKEAVEKIRAIKDAAEIKSIKEAVFRAESAFLKVMPYIKSGVRENAIASRLEAELKKTGCNRIPFDIIVASGANSAMPHARATDKKIAPGDLVIIDWGGEASGYFSDMTRTLIIAGGGDRAKKTRIHNLVLEANRKGISSAMAGVRAGEIDNKARNVIKKAGYGDFFGHALGHGVGMDVHERPHIRGGKSKETIKPGMVFTIEPGIYLPGMGGVRIEDMVLAGEAETEVLTSLGRGPKGEGIRGRVER